MINFVRRARLVAKATFAQITVGDADIVRVQGEPPSCYLIAMPKGSVYEGLRFWHPAQCTFRMKRGGYRLSFRKDDWEFKLYSQSEEDIGKYECRVILNADEMLSCWQS